MAAPITIDAAPIGVTALANLAALNNLAVLLVTKAFDFVEPTDRDWETRKRFL